MAGVVGTGVDRMSCDQLGRRDPEFRGFGDERLDVFGFELVPTLGRDRSRAPAATNIPIPRFL